ncbi:DUF1223 domain-containing protein [Tundrisphaera sp. TA3]|uniref:DUF1223 domain-containing protein n=1 Tax=Tundrisphaera sp. TA3 TaxID=3435775 RepID=UPI003EBD80FF
MSLHGRPWYWMIAACLAALPASAAEPEAPARRLVLVELFTSQGCDMCPKAEEILGELAKREPGIVPIAFHVDYFNAPWKDVFSDPLYSRRQMTYHQVYTKPKPPEYGLYYTPMLMVDGEQSVNGRDPEAARAAIRAARAKRPAVSLSADLAVKDDGRSGTVRIKLAARSEKAENAPLLVCAVLREDGVATAIASGENKGKTLVARYPARQTKYDFLTLRGRKPEDQEFTFALDPSWDAKALRLAVFAQDKRTGAIHQAVDLPWLAPGKPRP